MNMQQTCDPDRLDAFVRGDLSEQQESELTAHLDQCAACGDELERRVAAAAQWREAGDLLTQRTRRSNVVDLAYDPSTSVVDLVKDPSTSGSLTTSTTFGEQIVGMLAPTDDPEMLGRIGGYEVSGVIGYGGMGVVFKAHDRSLDRVVAIKVMAPHLAGSGAARKRFARESKAAAAVLHPNVIAIHCVADDPKLPYLVMPYIGGASLQKRIEADGPLCTQDTLRIGQQIAAGLAAAHAQGLVHRDIKPANILLERGVERVTITDFGLARAVDDATMTRSGVIAGTPQYMSPEQARGESIDHRSDLFSLGSVLYMMCAGHSPFRAETTFGILRRITDNPPRPLREINPDVPEWLCAIIDKLHAKEPSERFQSAEEVAELLEGSLAHVQQPATTPLPSCVQALAVQSQSSSTESLQANRLKAKHQRIPPIPKYIAAAAGAFALFFAGILIVLELDKGTLTIESELDDVPIRIMQGDEVVKSLTVSKEGATTRIGAGKYIVEIGQEFDKAVVKDGGVELSRGATAIVKVAQTNANTAEDEKAKDEAAKAWLRRPVVGSTHDGKSFQLAGHDALMDCVMRNNSEALNRLLTVDKYDLDFSPRDGQWTLLQIALLHECLETTSLLLRHGANPNFASKGTPLPLEIAKRSGRKQLVALVQKHLESVALHPQTKVANFDPIRDHGLSTDSIEARTDGRFGTLKIIEPTSLEDAVTKFNLLAKEHPLGRSQPGLTVEEMTAAFRLWIASDECNEATRKDFQQVLDTQMLRPGHILQFDTTFETDGHLFEVWSIQFGDDKSYAWFKIRDTKLLSRIKTDEERKAWEQRIDQMKKSFREFKRSGKAERVSQSELDNNASDPPAMPSGTLNKVVDLQPEFPLIAWDFEYPLLGRRMAKLRVSKDLDMESVFPGRQTVKGKAPEAEVKELIELIAQSATVDDGVRYQNTVSRIAEFDQLDTSVRTERVAVNREGRVRELQLNKSLHLEIVNRLWRLEGIAAIGGQDALTDLMAIANQRLRTQFPEITYTLTARNFLFGVKEDSGTRIVNIRVPVNKSESTNTTEMNFTLTVPSIGEPKFEQVAVTNSADDPPIETPPLPKTLGKSTQEMDSPKIYTAEELIANGMDLHKNQQPVTVRFKIASVRRNGVIDPDGKETQHWFLSSEEYKGGPDPEAFQVQVSMDAEKSLERSGVKDIPAHFNGQELIIVGKVSTSGLELPGRDTIWFYSITLERLDQLLFVKANSIGIPPQSQRDPIAQKLNVAKGQTDDLRSGQSYEIKLLVLASDDLKPVAGAMVDVTLIRSDSGITGDGGFAGFKTDEDGIATIDKSLWPGRYQIQVRAPKDSRFRDTEFEKEESILVVHEDGRYSPREFRLSVKDEK